MCAAHVDGRAAALPLRSEQAAHTRSAVMARACAGPDSAGRAVQICDSAGRGALKAKQSRTYRTYVYSLRGYHDLSTGHASVTCCEA